MKKIYLFILAFATLLSCFPSSDPVFEKSEPTKPESEQTPDPESPVQFESSYEAVANMGVGWNLGNTLESVWTGDTDGRDWKKWETGWGQAVTTPELISMMRDAGFGAIRVPVSWGVHMDADGKVYDEWMDRVEQVVGYVLDAGLYCIINVHHDTGADEELAWLVASPEGYAAEKNRFEGLWKQIALRFKDYDQRLLFESFNEMLDKNRSWCFASYNAGYNAELAAGAYKAINDYAQSFVDVVRSTGGNNSVRNLVVNTYGACNGGGDWNSHLQDPLKEMKMPSDKVEDHILFQVHSYPMIDDLGAMEREMGKMLDDLEKYLVSLGGPVIVGEWGTFSENPSVENYCYYARWFVGECKRRGIGTFHWMSLSDGVYRGIPCFNQPEIAEAIVKGYHGESFVPVIPVKGDFEFIYKVTYRDLWSELNLSSSTLDLSEYKGVRFELAEAPARGMFHVKIYGESDGMEQYVGVEGVSVYAEFDPDILGCSTSRVTLQYLKEGGICVELKNVYLVRTDGTEEEYVPSAFWGCSLELSTSR